MSQKRYVLKDFNPAAVLDAARRLESAAPPRFESVTLSVGTAEPSAAHPAGPKGNATPQETTGPRESPTDVINEIGSWYSVWLMAIARSWADETFKAKLMADPRKTLADELHYTYPEDIILTLKDATGVDDSGFTNVGGNGVWKVPPTEVTLWIPPRPKADEQAVALGSYQYTSQTYPFSCCC